jgi:hypothetical protein
MFQRAVCASVAPGMWDARLNDAGGGMFLSYHGEILSLEKLCPLAFRSDVELLSSFDFRAFSQRSCILGKGFFDVCSLMKQSLRPGHVFLGFGQVCFLHVTVW